MIVTSKRAKNVVSAARRCFGPHVPLSVWSFAVTVRSCARSGWLGAAQGAATYAKSKKDPGGKGGKAAAVELDRILGYHSDEDSGGASGKSSGAESEADVATAPPGSGGVLDR